MNGTEFCSPAVGKRMRVNGHVGTIKYVGEISGTNGTWLGIEWDDTTRGKHNGSKDGRHYFVCRTPGSGSFIRSSPSISYGQSFLQALVSKYVDLPQISGVSGMKEMIVLGSSNGAIEVEAVGFDKVRSKLANLERLREISLISENVAWVDPPGRIRETCPNVRSLDLSNSLLPSWDMVALIAVELSQLRELSLNACRISMAYNLHRSNSSLSNLEELRINQTLTNWNEIVTLIFAMPRLKYLEAGGNRMDVLGGDILTPGSAAMLKTLNLDENKLQGWTDIMSSTSQFPTLDRLILTSNAIETIPDHAVHSTALDIKHLGLQDNKLSTWRDIDALSAWLPALQTLTMNGNPLVTISSDFRQQAIARLPELVSLNGSQISAKERIDCEVYYLAEVARSYFASDAERTRHHPRWLDLCAKHGRPEDERPTKGPITLAGRLININVYRCDSDKPVSEAVSSALQEISAGHFAPFELKVLPTIRRSRHPSIWLLIKGVETLELISHYDSRELSWLGFQEGSTLLVQV